MKEIEDDSEELHCDPDGLHSPNSFQFSTEPDRTGCNAVTSLTCESAAPLKLLAGNLKLCKFRNVGLDSQMYNKKKTNH